MSVELNDSIRAEVEALLGQYRTQVGSGKMVRAANTVGDIIHLLLDAVRPNVVVTPLPAPAKPVETKFNIEVTGMTGDAAKEVLTEQLAKVAESHAAAVEAAAVPAPTPEPVVEASANAEPCAPCDVSIPNNPDLIDAFKEPVVPVEAAAEEPAAKVDVAPAPKTQKPKSST